MSTITLIVEADGPLPLSAELRYGEVTPAATVERLSVLPDLARSGSGKGFGALIGKHQQHRPEGFHG